MWIIALATLVGVSLIASRAFRSQAQQTSSLALDDIPFDGQRAYDMLKKICAIGPRVAGSEGMKKQQQLLESHFEAIGGQVSYQRFPARHPLSGDTIELANMIVTWHPDREKRVLLCAHYDTRPFPDNDPDPAKRKGRFIGANDGASGVALLAELGYHMPQLDSRFGVDFVLFDAEELIFEEKDQYFLGSTHFAQQYVTNRPKHQYLAGVLFDMVADRELQLFKEINSMRFPRSRRIMLDIWRTAKKLGVKEFYPTSRHEVRDDHLPLNQIAKIPTCDVIDFNYGRGLVRPQESYWHTTMDTPDKCSALSLAKVGWVMKTWLENL